MRKILSFVAAMLVALVANAQTDFASPGYSCTADAGVISGDAPSDKVYLDETADPHHIAWSDVSKTYTTVVTWNVAANRACYISVSLDLGPAIASNKHIFEVKLLDAEGKELGALEEGPAYTGDGFTEANQVKVLSGKLLIPAAGNYSIELRNNRDFCKGSIKNVILTYAGDAPVTDFAAPGFSCAADDGVITGDAPSDKVYLDATADPHHIAWSDVSKTYTAAVEWKVIATRACYVTVGLDLGPAISSNKHIFDVELYDADGLRLDTIAEGPAYTGDGFTEANQVKTLDGQLLIPEAGEYTIKLKNNRDYCKGSIKNVILTYAAPAPVPPTPQPVEVSWDWSKASYSSASESSVVWSGDDVTLTLAKANSQTVANNYLGGGSNNHTRVYASQTLTFAPAEGVTIESIEITATSNDYAGKFKNSTWTNASASTSGSIVTVTPADGASAVVCTITAATRATEVKVTYLKGEAPAVAKPAIAGEEFFYDTTLVTITCATEGAAIYYTLDGTEPTAASTQYTAAFNLTASATVKAIAILGSDASAVVEAQFTKNPSFASFEALIAAGVADKTLVEVSFADIVIDSIYVNSSNLRKGIYFTVGETAYEIYYSNGDVVIPEEWVAGGKVSGTIRGNWTEFKGLWEIVPTAPWAWDKLTYAAPTPVVPVQYCALATGHLNNPEFADPNGRILLTIKKGEGNNIIVAIKNNNEAGNPKTGLNYLWVNAQGATAVARYGDGTHDEADVEEVSVVVEFNEAKETYNFINIHWAYSGWTGEWAIDGLDVAASELCPGTDPVVGATNYYLVGSMNNWTPGLTDDFGQNPGAEGEYMAKATLAVGDEFKVIGITSGVLNPDTTWYPEGTNNNYIVDVDHAGAAKNIYFRPDGQGGEGWHYGVIFVEPNQDALKAVSDSTTWNFSKLTQDTLNSLYNKSDDAIKLSGETTPSTADELIYANYDSLWTIAADFDGEAIAFTGQYPIRKNQFCQNGVLRIKTTVAGNIYVKFSDTGSKASATAVKRYLMVNGDSTEYWASREKTGEGAYSAQLNVETGAIHVPAGDVTITGSSAIVVYYVTFVPDAAPTVNYYVAGSMNGWKADENYMLTPNNESLYEGEFTFAANDAFKVIGYDGSNTTWYPGGTNNDYKITEAGDYKITFNPAGNVEGWHEGYFNVVMKEAPIDTIPTTAPAAPTEEEEDVMAIYCDYYKTNNLHFGISGYAGAYETLNIDSTKIAYWKAMTWECVIDPVATNDPHDVSGYKKLHVDFWAPAAAKIKFTAEAVAGGNYKDGVVLDLAKGWTSWDIEIATWPGEYDFSNLKCLVLEHYEDPTGASFEGNPFAVANIYFYEKKAEGFENIDASVKAVKVLYNGQILILKNNKVYTVTGQPVNMK